MSELREGADSGVGLACLDHLDVPRREIEPFGELLLREIGRRAKLGDPSPKVTNDLVLVGRIHPEDVAEGRPRKHETPFRVTFGRNCASGG